MLAALQSEGFIVLAVREEISEQIPTSSSHRLLYPLTNSGVFCLFVCFFVFVWFCWGFFWGVFVVVVLDCLFGWLGLFIVDVFFYWEGGGGGC